MLKIYYQVFGNMIVESGQPSLNPQDRQPEWEDHSKLELIDVDQSCDP